MRFSQLLHNIFCRTGAHYWRSHYEFGQGSGAMYYSYFNCGGGEDTISHCSQSPVSCSNNYGITVVCNPGKLSSVLYILLAFCFVLFCYMLDRTLLSKNFVLILYFITFFSAFFFLLSPVDEHMVVNTTARSAKERVFYTCGFYVLVSSDRLNSSCLHLWWLLIGWRINQIEFTAHISNVQTSPIKIQWSLVSKWCRQLLECLTFIWNW